MARVFGWWSHASGKVGEWRLWINGPQRQAIRLELAIPSHSWFSLGVELGGDEDKIKGHLCLLRIGLYWGLWFKFLPSAKRHQEWQFGIYEGTVRLELGANAHEWSRNQPWWWSNSWNIPDILFGRQKYSSVPISETAAEIPMIERSYPCTVKMSADKWKRPRLPWTRTIIRANVDIPGGVPVPGKGENSWDCDEDAIFSMTCPAKDAADAVQRVVASANETRRRHGGPMWRPGGSAVQEG